MATEPRPVGADAAGPPAATVRTKSFVLAQTVAARAVELNAIAGFFGDPGTGKTHAARHFCATSPVEVVYITASPSPQLKEIYEELLTQTLGEMRTGSVRDLRRLCAQVLGERRRVVVIDECQHLSYLWHQQLRTLHDHPDAQFSMLLVGGRNAERTLKRDPQLWSRVKMRVHFEALEGNELVEALAAMHPVFANTDPQLLQDIDRKSCRGNLREWTTFLELASPLLRGSRHPDRLTTKVVRAVFTLRGVS
jgi:DNA transposition AAA+ family ATPase